MTKFEQFYLAVEPFYLPIHRLAREKLVEISKKFKDKPLILDVGGRKSHYTIGVNGTVVVSDLPRETEVQKSLHLGIDDSSIALTKSRRSNIKTMVYDDMTVTKLEKESFDIIIAIEVLEHVEEDQKFVDNVYKVLKPGGYFIMTTPNGDWKTVVNNKDHKRHYRHEQLHKVLSNAFRAENVVLDYAIVDSKYRTWGLQKVTPSKPLQSLKSVFGNLKSYMESTRPEVKRQVMKTAHHFAVCQKPA